MNKSYKMVVLRVLLDHDSFWTGMPIESLALACREFLLSHPVLRPDLPPTKQIPNHATASAAQWTAWWLEWPLSRWMDAQAGRRWFKQEAGGFVAAFNWSENARAELESITSELVDYRLAQYTNTRLGTALESSPDSFVGKVTHSGGRPILMLPTAEEVPGRPVGPIEATLPDGSVWIFRCVRIACNVAMPKGTEGNQLGDLMRHWFGPDAGLPGTGFKVIFKRAADGWPVAPAETAATDAK